MTCVNLTAGNCMETYRMHVYVNTDILWCSLLMVQQNGDMMVTSFIDIITGHSAYF